MANALLRSRGSRIGRPTSIASNQRCDRARPICSTLRRGTRTCSVARTYRPFCFAQAQNQQEGSGVPSFCLRAAADKGESERAARERRESGPKARFTGACGGRLAGKSSARGRGTRRARVTQQRAPSRRRAPIRRTEETELGATARTARALVDRGAGASAVALSHAHSGDGARSTGSSSTSLARTSPTWDARARVECGGGSKRRCLGGI